MLSLKSASPVARKIRVSIYDLPAELFDSIISQVRKINCVFLPCHNQTDVRIKVCNPRTDQPGVIVCFSGLKVFSPSCCCYSLPTHHHHFYQYSPQTPEERCWISCYTIPTSGNLSVRSDSAQSLESMCGRTKSIKS